MKNKHRQNLGWCPNNEKLKEQTNKLRGHPNDDKPKERMNDLRKKLQCRPKDEKPMVERINFHQT